MSGAPAAGAVPGRWMREMTRLMPRAGVAFLLALLCGRPADAANATDVRVVPSIELESGLNIAWIDYAVGERPYGNGPRWGRRGAVNFVYGAQQPLAVALSVAYDQRGAKAYVREDFVMAGLSLRFRLFHNRPRSYLSVGPEVGVSVEPWSRGTPLSGPRSDLRLGIGIPVHSHLVFGMSYTHGLSAVGDGQAEHGPHLEAAHDGVLGVSIGVHP